MLEVEVRKGKGNVIKNGNSIIIFTDEPFENNRANLDIIKKIAKEFNVDFKRVKIIKGRTSRKKLVEIREL